MNSIDIKRNTDCEHSFSVEKDCDKTSAPMDLNCEALPECNQDIRVEHNKPSDLTLSFYLSIALIANFFFLFYSGFKSDLGYWENWIKQLSTTGYDGFDGNYPPLYIHWLYIVGKIYSITGIPLHSDNYLKFLSQIPIIAVHCVSIFLIDRLQRRYAPHHNSKHALMMFAALNPAFFINGSMWGQIDLLPSVIALASIICATSQRWAICSIPLFAMALLTKFQMIAFAPILGILFFKNISKHLIGVLIALIIGVIAFLPSILSGHFVEAFQQAYIDTLGQYPKTTLNAANLWILLTGNDAPDHIMLFGIEEDSMLAWVFKAKHFGMLLFSGLALMIFLVGLRSTYRKASPLNDNELTCFSLFCATLCALGFFTLLPAMHERYLFPAAVMAIALWACQSRMALYAIFISMVCALNMLIILAINGANIWTSLATITVLLLVTALMHLLFKKPTESFFRASYALLNKRYTWVATLVVGMSFVTYVLHSNHKVEDVELKNNQLWLTSITPHKAIQSHGKMRINRSHDGNTLSLANRRYAQGIGTHTDSEIEFSLPDNALTFSFIAGVDDEVGTADAQFFVYGDDKLLWQSPMYFGYEKYLPTTTVDVTGVKVLRLQVTKGKEDKWDHVDWVNTIITLDQ